MDVVYATRTSVVAMPGGYTLRVEYGTHWPADDPLVLEHPDLFSANPRYGMSGTRPPAVEPEERPVERMTAAPGEKRNVVRPRV